MTEAAKLHVAIGADIADFTKKLGQAARGAADSMADVGRSTAGAAGGLGKLMSAAKDLGASFKANLGANLAADAIQGVASAAVDLGKKALGLAGDLEQSKVAFTTMLGSAEKADKFLRELASFAAATPFELRGLQDSAKRLLAFGLASKDVIPVLTGVGNAVAGLGGGKDVLDGITTALGQMLAKGKASAEEMGQLAERGVPAWEMLAKSIGVSVPEAMKMAEKGMITGAKAVEAIVNGMNERFPNMMEKQSKTLLGAWSNLTDGIDGLLTRIGLRFAEAFNLTGIITALSRTFGMISEALDENGGVLGAINAAFGPASRALILGIGTAITAALLPSIGALVTSIMTTAIPAIKALALSWAPAIAAAAPYIGLAAAVAFAAYPIIKNWDTLGAVLRDVWASIANGAASMWNGIRGAFSRAMDAAWSLAKTIVAALKPIFDNLKPLWDKLPEGFRLSFGEVARTAYHLPGELAANIRAGNGPVLGAAKWAAGQFASTWGDALSGAQAVTSRIFGGIGQQTAAFGKATALHLAGAGKAAVDAAGKVKGAGEAARRAAAEAKKAHAEAEKAAKAYAESLERGEKAMAAFSQKIDVLADLGHAMRDAEKLSKTLGGRFDVNADKANSLKLAIDRLKRLGFEDTNRVVRDLTATMHAYERASNESTKATAEAYKTLDGATKKIATARRVAAELGEAFDETKFSTETYRGALVQMVEDGVKKADPAFVELKKKIDESRMAAETASPRFGDFRNALQDSFSSASGLGSSLKGVLEAVGGGALTPIAEAATAFGSFGSSLAGVVKAASELAPQVITIGKYLTGDGLEAVLSFGKALTDWLIPSLENTGRAMDASLGAAALIVITHLRYMAEMLNSIATAFGGWAEVWGITSQVVTAAGWVMFESFRAIFGGIGGLFAEGLRGLGDIAARVFFGVTDVVKGAWDGIANIVKGSVNVLVAAVNAVIRGMNSIGRISVPDWVPGIGGAKWGGFNFEEIPYLAAGALVTGPTVAMVGEGRHQEAVLPLSDAIFSRLGQGIADHGGAGGGPNIQVVINYQGKGRWSRQDADELGELLVGRLKGMGVRTY